MVFTRLLVTKHLVHDINAAVANNYFLLIMITMIFMRTLRETLHKVNDDARFNVNKTKDD